MVCLPPTSRSRARSPTASPSPKPRRSLPAGPHTVSLQCTESNPDLTIDNPTIAAVAVTTDNH